LIATPASESSRSLYEFGRQGADWAPLWWARYSHFAPVLVVSRSGDHRVGDSMLAYLAADDRFLGLNRGDWGFLFGASAMIVAATFLLT